jgi:hypothetical protein
LVSVGQGDLRSILPLRRLDRRCQNVGKSGQKIYIVLVESALHGTVRFQHTVRPAGCLDDDVDGRNYPVLGIEARQ